MVQKYPGLEVSYKTPEFFLKILAAIAYLTRNYNCGRQYCYPGEVIIATAYKLRNKRIAFSVDTTHRMHDTGRLLVNEVSKIFNPHGSKNDKNGLPIIPITIYIESKDINSYFLTARERMSVEKWLRKQLIEMDISTSLLDAVLLGN